MYLNYGLYRNYDANVEGNREMIRCNIVREHLEALGANTQLIVFMTGAGGLGKSNVISALFAYCKEFVQTLVPTLILGQSLLLQSLELQHLPIK